MVLYFFEAIKADEGYGGLTGPSDGISNMKSQGISTEEGYGGLTGPSDGLSNKKHWYEVRRDKVVEPESLEKLTRYNLSDIKMPCWITRLV